MATPRARNPCSFFVLPSLRHSLVFIVQDGRLSPPTETIGKKKGGKDINIYYLCFYHINYNLVTWQNLIIRDTGL